MEIKHYVEMKCIKCKKRKPLKDFGFDYNVRRPVCLDCGGPKEWITFRRVYKIKFKKKKKNKYPAEFKKKSKIMLQEARENNGCTDCGSKDILQVHHIDKNTFNNSDENLVVLCYYCHAKHHKHMQHKPPNRWVKQDINSLQILDVDKL